MKEEILKNKRFDEVYKLYRTKLNLKDNDKVFEYFYVMQLSKEMKLLNLVLLVLLN